MIPFPYQTGQLGRALTSRVVTDPNFASVSLLLHMNGTNGSTSFPDTSPSPKTMTANGNVQVSTAQSVFGGASALFDGAGDFISTPSNAAFNMGTGDFTIEFWARFAATGSRYICTGQSDAAGNNASLSFLVEKNASNFIRAFCCSSSTVIGDVVGTTSISANVWYHIAYTRSGTNFRLFVNGNLEASPATSSASVNASSNPLSIGRLGLFDSAYVNGYIDEYRITKGVARYTASFTVPTEQFPDS